MDAIRLGRLAIEHDINTAGWASTEVLLSELLNLLLNGRAGLKQYAVRTGASSRAMLLAMLLSMLLALVSLQAARRGGSSGASSCELPQWRSQPERRRQASCSSFLRCGTFVGAAKQSREMIGREYAMISDDNGDGDYQEIGLEVVVLEVRQLVEGG